MSEESKCTGAVRKTDEKATGSTRPPPVPPPPGFTYADAGPSHSPTKLAREKRGHWNKNLTWVPEFRHPTDIVFGQEIGKAFNGTVRVARHFYEENCNNLYAVKIYNTNDWDVDLFPLVQTEVANIKKLMHPNLLPITASLTHSLRVYLITPLMAARSVQELITTKYLYGIPTAMIAVITADVADALVYLHNRNFIHRSIKASHILLTDAGRAILSGFRYMIEKTSSNPVHVDDLDQMKHNLHWLSPEILNQDYGGYGLNSDVYSLGMTILEMGNGMAAIDTTTPSLMFLKKVGCPSPELMDANNSYVNEMAKYDNCQATGSGDGGPEMKITVNEAELVRDDLIGRKEYGPDIKDFVSLCLIVEKRIRPDIQNMTRHSFLKNLNKAARILLIQQIRENLIKFDEEYKFPDSPPVSGWDFGSSQE